MKIFLCFVLAVMPLACGPTVKVTVKGTKEGVNISTTQSASDSSSLDIHVAPNITFNADGTKI